MYETINYTIPDYDGIYNDLKETILESKQEYVALDCVIYPHMKDKKVRTYLLEHGIRINLVPRRNIALASFER